MKQCEICGKGSIMRGNRKKLRGKYNLTHKSRKFPNLQKALINSKRVLACTQCMKTAVKVPKIKTPKVFKGSKVVKAKITKAKTSKKK